MGVLSVAMGEPTLKMPADHVSRSSRDPATMQASLEGWLATQLEAAWPLKRTFLHMNGYLYAQYFRGWGETLLDYDRSLDPQFRIGIALVP